ncbi:MAG: hypothetical protein U1F43_18815 [Myxococcota bacterium]
MVGVALLVHTVAGGVLAGVRADQVARGLPTPWMGITERLNSYGFMVWAVAFALVLLRAMSRAAMHGEGAPRRPRPAGAASSSGTLTVKRIDDSPRRRMPCGPPARVPHQPAQLARRRRRSGADLAAVDEEPGEASDPARDVRVAGVAGLEAHALADLGADLARALAARRLGAAPAARRAGAHRPRTA